MCSKKALAAPRVLTWVASRHRWPFGHCWAPLGTFVLILQLVAGNYQPCSILNLQLGNTNYLGAISPKTFLKKCRLGGQIYNFEAQYFCVSSSVILLIRSCIFWPLCVQLHTLWHSLKHSALELSTMNNIGFKSGIFFKTIC